MGYHVEIIKTKDGMMHPLSQGEILIALEDFSGLEFVDDAIVKQDGNILLAFNDGILWLKNPGEVELSEMISLANKLGARVRGDELETYISTNEVYLHPDDEKLKIHATEKSIRIIKDAKRRQLILNACIFCSFFVLVLCLKLFGFLE